MGLVGWWKLDGDGSDSSGYGMTANPTGSISYSNGKIGSAGVFNGASYLTTSNYTNLYGSQSFSAWVYKEVGGDLVGIVSTHNHGAFSNITFSSRSNNLLYMGFGYDDGTRDTNAVASSSAIFLETWTHVVATYEASTNTGKIYIDGILDSEVILPKNPQFTNYPVTIGRWAPSYGPYDFYGMIDDVRVYDHTLSAKEVYELSKAKMLHYTFDNFEEPTLNYAQYTITAYAPYYTYSRSGDTHYALRQEGSTSPTLALQCPTFTSAVSTGTVYTISGYLYLNNIPHQTTQNNISTYHTTRLNRIIGPGGYFEYTQEFNTSGWIIHSNLCNAQIGDTIIIRNLQIEIKDHATPFVSTSRDGTVSDSSGYAHHAPMHTLNSPMWQNNAVVGAGSYKFMLQRILYPSNIILVDRLTLACWVKLDTLRESGFIQSDYYLSCGADGRLRAYWYGTSSEGYHVSPNVLPIGEWVHVAAVWNGTQCILYENGEEVQRVNTNTPGRATTAYVAIGTEGNNWPPTSSRQIHGSIDDVRIYATALSESDINDLIKNRQSIDSGGNLHSRQLIEMKHKPLIMDYTIWENGQTGAVGNFNQYSSVNEQALTIDPWGKETVCWQGVSLDGSIAGTGIYYNPMPIDNTKTYRMSWWELRVTNAEATFAHYYAGLNGYGDVAGVWNLTADTYNTNPYFWSTSYPGLPVGEWFLVVGHVHPYTYTAGTTHPDSGRYQVGVGRIGNINTDYRWAPETTTGRSRTLMIYQPNAQGVIHQTVYPRIDICDGTEPTIGDLLAGYDSRKIDIARKIGGTNGYCMDLGSQSTIVGNMSELGPIAGSTGYFPLDGNANNYSDAGGNGTVYGTAVPAPGVKGLCYSFDGSTGSYIRASAPILTTSWTISLWVLKRTHTVQSYPIFLSFGLPYIANDSSASPFRLSYTSGSQVHTTGTTIPELDTWYHVVATSSSDGTRIYVNGILEGTNSLLSTNNSSTFDIGRHLSSDTYRIDGMVDEVRIYGRPLSDEEVSILYNVTKPGAPKISMSSDTVYVSGEFKEF